MENFKMSIYVKNNGKYTLSYETTDRVDVLERLSGALIAKKLNACRYITRIQRANRYDGTQLITVLYDNGVKNEFLVPTSL